MAGDEWRVAWPGVVRADAWGPAGGGGDLVCGIGSRQCPIPSQPWNQDSLYHRDIKPTSNFINIIVDKMIYFCTNMAPSV